MKRDGVDRMFPKVIKVCRQLPCLSNTEKKLFYCCSCNCGTPVCTMFNKIAQYLKFFMFFLGVTIRTSAS